MSNRQELEKRIEKKKAEIAELEAKIREEKAFLSGLQESLRFFPKDDSGTPPAEPNLRPGTDLYKTKEYLQKLGHSAYITDILIGIGKEATKENRVSLSGNLSWYVRKGLIFIRPKPNTFGLIGMKEDEKEEVGQEEIDESSEGLTEDALPLQ